jgi:hypothetical protein
MPVLRFGTIAGVAVALCLVAQLAPALSQVEVRAPEVRQIPVTPTIMPVPALPLTSSLPLGSTLPPPPSQQAPPPVAARPAPVAALPSAAGGGSPPFCRPKTTAECSAETASCLVAKGIADKYHVGGEGSALAVYSSRTDASRQQAEAAGDCAKDLQRCLAGGC